MAVVNEARAILSAEDRASAVLAMVARNFDRLDRAASRINATTGNVRAQEKMAEATSRTAAITSSMGAAALRAMPAVAGFLGVYGAGAALTGANKAFATNERAMTRIAVTADASTEAQKASWVQLQNLAQDAALPVDKVREGLDALVASGRSLPEAMSFLPSVARTAQASGAEVSDIAKTADSVGESFKIAGADMGKAFDIMAAGGKAGKFELKDMARYLPSLGPAASAIGFEGQKGLSDLVAMLQVMRKGSGTAEEAVASMNNILNKMESDKTTKEFKKLGVDSEEAFKKARKEGRNLVEVYEELVNKALKGDRSRLGEIIDDAEFKRGTQALMMYRGEWQRLSETMQKTSAGTVMTDLARVTSNSQAGFDRLKNSGDRLADTLGNRLQPIFAALAKSAADKADAINKMLTPGETDEEREKRIGNIPKTRAEQSIENARRMQEGKKALEDPNSDIYSMGDRGFHLNPKRHARPLKETPEELLQQALAARRSVRLEEAEEAASRSVRARAGFLMDERNQAAGDGTRAGDAYRDVDALNRRRRRVSADGTAEAADSLLGSHGESSREVMAAMMNLAQLVRAEKLMGTGESNVFGLGNGGTRDIALTAMSNALRDIAERQAGKTGQPVDETALAAAIASMKSLAERIGETVPVTGPKGRVDGLYQNVEEILKGKITAEVKPDQITAKTDVDVNSQVTVKIEAPPGWQAMVTASQTRTTTRDSRGVSLPGKELPQGSFKPSMSGF